MMAATLQAAAVSGAATLLTPTNGSVLGTTQVVFTWNSGTGVAAYHLILGSGLGLQDVYNSGTTNNLSVTAPSIPANGLPVYGRLFSKINGAWQYNDYRFTAAGAPVAAALLTPTSGTVLGTSNVTFTWDAGKGVAAYHLTLGSAPGIQDVYDSGTTNNLTATARSIPATGQPVYGRLFSKINGAWQYNDYRFTAAGAPVAAALLTPASGTVLGTSNVTFTWDAGKGVAAYHLTLGTAPGIQDVYNSGTTNNLTTTAPSIPATGQPVYGRLFSKINGAWQYNDYRFMATGAPVPATLQGPASGTTLGTSDIVFTWNTGTGVAAYHFILGTAPGLQDLYDSGTTNNLTVTAPTLPGNGQTVYGRLFSKINGAWQYTDSSFVEYWNPVAAALTSPVSGSVLAPANVTFTWNAGSGVTGYQLDLGTGPGLQNLYISGVVHKLSATVPAIPVDGKKVYARLFSRIAGVWQHTDYVFQASTNLIVADSGNNRVLIYKPPFTTGESASAVLGQSRFDTGDPGTSATRMSYPSAVALDKAGNLYVIESYSDGGGNARTLQFKPPFTTGMSASAVVGVPDFTTPGNNQREPTGVAVDGSGNLWVSSSDGGTILKYQAPITTGAVAVASVGVGAPVGIAFDGSGNLWVADAANHRVLEVVTSSGTPVLELGQPASTAFDSFSPNNGGISASSMNGPTGVVFDRQGTLWVTDSGNNRVLHFTPPFTNGMDADMVVGQPDFVSAQANQGAAAGAGTLKSPTLASVVNDDLIVGDTGNNRTLVFAQPFSTGMNATAALGQADFTGNSVNQGLEDPTAATESSPYKEGGPSALGMLVFALLVTGWFAWTRRKGLVRA